MERKKRGPLSTDCGVLLLGGLSKAALIDCVIDLLRPLKSSVDDEVTRGDVYERLDVVLRLRGDRWPLSSVEGQVGDRCDCGDGDCQTCFPEGGGV